MAASISISSGKLFLRVNCGGSGRSTRFCFFTKNVATKADEVNCRHIKLRTVSGRRKQLKIWHAAGQDAVPAAEDGDGISLGTMKLPLDTDITRFETLLFQWGNSLCQGASIPLPMPLKVDKVEGGIRLGFVTVDDGKTEVPVYIDCLVFPATEESGVPLFRAVRNGIKKGEAPPGEPRIMKSLLAALQKSVEIARIN